MQGGPALAVLDVDVNHIGVVGLEETAQAVTASKLGHKVQWGPLEVVLAIEQGLLLSGVEAQLVLHEVN